MYYFKPLQGALSDTPCTNVNWADLCPSFIGNQLDTKWSTNGQSAGANGSHFVKSITLYTYGFIVNGITIYSNVTYLHIKPHQFDTA